MQSKHDPKDIVNVFDAINSRLHAARFITLNNNKVMDCLADMEKIYQAKNNDSNGERSEEEMQVYFDKTITMLMEKYSIKG